MYGLWLYKEIKTEYGNCKVELYRKGYTASAVEIGGFVGNSLNLALENLDTITAPIGKSVCSFSIYDTEQVEYYDLFTPDATAYKVVVSTKVDGGEYNTRWSGYVTPDFFAENLSFRTPISISARDNIGYLNDVDFDLDTATITVRELIQAAFNRIAEDYPMSLSFVTQKQTAEGILAIDATISTYLLREMSWYKALETILHDLGLQMRWVDNNTIAVLDISQLGENFGLQRFNFIDRSGYREILPAWRELSQKQDYGLRENFFEGKMTTKELAFAKTQSLTVPDLGFRQDVRYYKPTNWGVARDIYTTDPSFYNSTFGNRLIFSAVSETYPETTYLSWSTNVLKSNVPLTVKCKALNSIIYPSGGVTPYPLQLKVYDPFLALGSREGDYLQIGLRMNLFLHTRDNKTYVMNKEWVEDNGTGSGTYINMTLDKVSLDAYNVIEGKGAFPIGSQPQEQELTITANTIPYDGALELRIYGYYVVSYQYADENIQSPNFDKFFTYIDDLTYTFEGNDISSGQESKVQVSELHNIKEDRDYSFGQVPLDCGGINAYAGGLFKANGDELVGFKRNVDGSTYPLLELVGREIIHFNKRNYNKLSGTIKNLAKEPLRFDRMLTYKGKNYLPFAYSLDVISNEMNVTTMQEVEPYITHSFVEIKSELVTGGGATVSGGNNTALQYSAEVGNAKRISELNNASESEKKESYIVIDNANWNESKKVPLSEMEGLDAEQVEEYLTENKYAKQSWVKSITDDLKTDIANRVLIEDFDKLQDAVDLNYANLNKATTRISTLEGYFSNGVANNAAKLGGRLPAYYATAAALETTNTNLSNLSTTVGTIAGNLSNLTGRVSTAEDTIKGHTSSISKAVADIAANAKNISANAAAIATLNSKVAKLESYWYIDDNGNLHTTYNIVSDKDVVAGGEYSGGSGGGGGTGLGTVTIKTVSGQEYKTNANGVVTIPDYQPKGNYLTAVPSGYATESWVGDNYQPKGNYLTAIPTEYITESELTAKKYLTGITSAMVTTALGYVPFNSTSFTKATIKSTLGIAEWALAATKPTYTASEVGALSTGGGTISKSSYIPLVIENTASDLSTILFKGASGDLGYLGFYGASNPIYMAPSGYSYTLYHTGNFNPANYLPLSGGTLTGNLSAPLYLFGNGGGTYLDSGASGELVFYDLSARRTVLHAGNYSSYALPLSGGTRTITSTANTSLILKTNGWHSLIQLDNNHGNSVLFGYYSGSGAVMQNGSNYLAIKDDGTPNYNGNTLIHSGNIGSQSVKRSNYVATMLVDGSGFYEDTYRLFGQWASDNNNICDWKAIGYEVRVDRARKLNTARTIWGQSFDGTGNVSGVLTLPANHQIQWVNSNSMIYGNGSNITISNTGNLAIATSGNVLIGAATDSGNGAKLQVSGLFSATGDGVFGSDARYKSKLQDLAVDIETIANAPVFSYKWTDREDDKVHLGTTAQYWLPTKFCDAVDTSNPNFYHLNYGALGVAIGVTVAKEQLIIKKEQIKVKSEVERLRERVNELESQVKLLRQWHN